MAEFKLGRIRFIWKDVWTPNTTYIKDDIIRNGGKTYVCVIGHVSDPDFYTDFDNIPTRWNQVADGSEWKGDWATGTFYKLNDLVKDGGRLYICNDSHTSAGSIASVTVTGNLVAGATTVTGLSDTTQLLAGMSLAIQGGGGTVTVATNTIILSVDSPTQVTIDKALTGTSTASGATLVWTTSTVGQPTGGSSALNANRSKWDLFLTALDWKGDWNVYTRYRINDVVRYGGQSYVCNEEHVSDTTLADGLEADQSKWDIYSESFEWNQDWEPNTRYKRNDVILYGGQSYVCNLGHTSAATYTLGLEADQSKWDYLHKGIEYKTGWDRGATFNAKIDDLSGGAGDTLTVNTVAFGVLKPGQQLFGAGVIAGTYIVSQLTGTTGGAGTYRVSEQHTISAITVTAKRRYKINDVVKWGADLWICTVNYSSDPANTFEYDEAQGRWARFVEGLQFENSWDNTTIYQPGDVVTYGGFAYICNTNHSDKLPTQNPIDWQLFTTGFKFQNDYDIATAYKVGDVVRLSGYTYVAILDNVQVTINAINTNTLVTIGLVAYDNVITLSAASTNLVAGLPITFTGTTFGGILAVDPISGLPKQYFVKQVISATQFTVSLSLSGPVVVLSTANGTMALTTNPEPPCTGFWSRLNSGVKWIDQAVTNLALTGTNVIGTGTGAKFDVVRQGTFYSVTVASGFLGTGYAVNNTIKILGTALGGVTPTNDLVITVASVSTGAISSITWAGTAVTWKIGTSYKQGDTVKWGVSTFLCVLRHVATYDVGPPVTGNRPDIDLNGTYWNMLAAGAEAAVLTTKGDTLYFGGAGPTRLPVGQSGQVLKVLGDTPGWEYFGVIDHVYYVAPSGIDTPAPAYGITVDKPWKTVRYATEQIAKGAKNYNSKYLIENNRQFIQKEVTGWIASTYTVNIGSTISSTDGLRPNQIVLSSGTTVNLSANMPIKVSANFGTMLTASTYYVKTIVDNTHFTVSATAGGVVFAQSTASGTITASLSYDAVKCERDIGYVVDALVYDLSHGGNSRSRNAALKYVNEAPLVYSKQQKVQTAAAVNYALTVITNIMNNVAPVTSYQGTVAQIIIPALVQEAVALPTLTTLTGIITSAILAENATNIPAEQLTNYTVNIKTGVFYEVLPITVPANVALVGDELRSTNIRPAGSLVSISDAPYSLDGYTRLKAVIGDIVQGNAITRSAGNTLTQFTAGPVATSTEATTVSSLVSQLRYTIDSQLNLLTDLVLTSPTGYNTSYLPGYGDARSIILANTAFIQAEVLQRITNTYPSLTYDRIKCARDIKFIIDAIRYDLTYGGNVAGLVAGNAYYAGTGGALQIASSELTAIVDAFGYMKTIIESIAVNTTITPLQTAVTQVPGLAGSGPAASAAGQALTNIIAIINTGTAPATVLPSTSWVAGALTTAQATLAAAKATIQANTITYINSTYPTLVYNSSKCSRDVGYVIDALGYDFMFNSNFQSYKSALSYANLDAALAVTTQKVATIAAWNYVKTQALASVGGDTTAQARITANMNLLISIVESGTFSGSNDPTSTQAAYDAARMLELNKEFLATEITSYIAVTYPSYTYDVAKCQRDVRSVVDAIKEDLIYVGNYRTRQAGIYYVNAVNGSVTSDMFYVRNGTGIRNMTLQGLSGYLSAPNAYGTKRPTAGAFTSLDPGWGPADTKAWVTNKSCYVQNVTTFGTGCVGCKIDGTLHNGGNRSIVSNDFTQVLSDGIGVWCTGTNALTELVSVFSYYGHMGYLAEDGGKIRATNGNSSYGTYGCVSEGVDKTEVPITAVVDNRYNEATITNVVTNNAQVWTVEYGNAGSYYDQATYTINGAGANAATEMTDFRDDAVFEVRITDPTSSGTTGGAGYITSSNVAQGGNTTQITLAATDGNLSSAYVGMRVLITSGTGVGQYGYVNTYNNGSKIATMLKDSTGTAGWDHIIPGTPIATTLDLTTSYIVEPRISFTAPTYTATATTQVSGTWIDATYISMNASYSALAATGGSGTLALFNVVKTGNTYAVTLNSGGGNYVAGETLTIAGTALGGLSTANDITIKIITVTAVSKAITNFTWTGFASGGRYVAISGSSTATQFSTNGTTWSSGGALPAGTYRAVVSGAVSGVSTLVTTSSPTSNLTARSVDGGTTWTAGGTLPASRNWEAVAYGNSVFVAVAKGTGTSVSTDAAYSINGGTTWVSSALPSAAWTGVAYGAGKFVAVATGVQTSAYSTSNGQIWITSPAGLPSTATWSSVTYGNGRFVAIGGYGANSTASAISLDGIVWLAGGTLPASQQWTEVKYGQGVFMAIAGTGTTGTTIATSEDGVLWTTRALTVSAAWSGAVAFGNPNWTPAWVVLGPTTTANRIVVGAKAKGRAKVTDNKIVEVRITDPGSGYVSAPTMTIGDPNRTTVLTWSVRTGKGALANPYFSNRGTLYTTATATVVGTGYADIYQFGTYVNVKSLTANPTAGSNIVFSGVAGIYKLVNVRNFIADNGTYIARFQVSPPMSVFASPEHDASATMRIKYSQVRLTGHDLLSIGTGNFQTTNYPGLPLQAADPAKELVERGGGRVFYTSTDQDGNFRVGTLFSIEQATGVATLNADAFNLAGLNELTLGSVALGGAGATISEFSTDPFFTANSDAIIPTQRAIKAYINSQIGGGGSQLNVNTLTAGVIFIANNEIKTTSGVQINVPSKMNFTGGIDGSPVALNFFLLG
jgi:hypothetical protein